MANPLIPVATLLLRLNAARGKASKLNKELVTESMKPRTRKIKEKQLEETIAKAREIEKQIPPDTPGFAMGGGVMQRPTRVTQGLTNLFNKYNTSGPLAGAGVPRGTMPVGMNQGGDPLFSGFPAAPQPGTTASPPVVDPVQFPQPIFSTAPALPPETALPPSVYTPPAQTAVTVPTQPMFTTPLSAAQTPGLDEEVDDSNFVFRQEGFDEFGMPVVSYGPPQEVDPNRFISVEDFERGLTSSQPPDPYAVPAAPEPGMLSDAVVDFNISDDITPQTEGYKTTRGMDIQATGDPFADAVEGEYQMALYRPTPTTDMPFLSLEFDRPPTAPDQAPPPPQSDQYSTGSYGRLEFAEAVADYERRFGPVEDYQAPDTDAVMTDDTTDDTTQSTLDGEIAAQYGMTVEQLRATNARRRQVGLPPLGDIRGNLGGYGTYGDYQEPPPVRGSGSIGPQNLYRQRLEAWEAQYGPVEDYYAAQTAAQQNLTNIYSGQEGEEEIAAQYNMTVEQLRDLNAQRSRRGLPPLGDILGNLGGFGMY